jgi:filamentous hemagglutinin
MQSGLQENFEGRGTRIQEYFLEGRLGDLANATLEIRRLMEQHGAEGLNLDGHSRGAMTIGNALESLAGQDGSAGLLSNTEIKFVGPAYSAQRAATLLEGLSNGNRSVVLLQNHADDFVGVLIGNNPATYDQRPPESSRLNEWWRILGDAPTAHSCYGTGAASRDCRPLYGIPRTIEVLSINPQGGVAP